MNEPAAEYYVKEQDIETLLDRLAQDGPVYIPSKAEGYQGNPLFRYKKRTKGESVKIFGYRPSEALKQFCFTGRKKVAEYPGGETTADEKGERQITIVGAASCDVASLRSLDAVFLQDEWTDIFYRDQRNRLFLISADCYAPRSTCFCTKAGIHSHPEGEFDLNLSIIEGGFIVEAGSEKGMACIETNSALFGEPTPAMLEERNRIRIETDHIVDEINNEYRFSRKRSDILASQRESDSWHVHAADCVDCGACLFSCPTCHCFLLSDHISGTGEFQRYKVWDSCSYAGYSRMAGGSSPRLGLMERFRHRYLHKFEYYPHNFGFEACTGCGRCIEGCMGKIDQRQVFTSLDRIETGAETI